MVTAVAPENPLPLMVTTVPPLSGPLVGPSEPIAGMGA